MLPALRNLTDAEQEMCLCDKQGLSMHRKVMLSDILLSEDVPHVSTCITLIFEREKKGWGIFKPKDSLRYFRPCFLLLCD